VLRKLDLASIASGIDTPFRPEPVASLGGAEASLFICEGQKGWHRRADADEVLFVLEGVMTIEGVEGLMVTDEGETVQVPEGVGLSYKSGMRTTVVLIHESEALASSNGHPPTPGAARTPLSKASTAVDVMSSAPFRWLAAGSVGGYMVSASRLYGAGAPYRPPGPMLVIVYRGVLDYEAGSETGSVAGSEALLVTGDTDLSLRSERGATVILLARKRSELPTTASAGTAGTGRDAGRGADPR
jgi:hypothetical protein